MDPSFFLIVIGVAAWLGVIAIAIAVPIRPDVVKITKWLVIPRDADMQVETYVAGYQGPGEKTIKIDCHYADGTVKSIKVRALFALWGMFFLPSLPIAFVVVRVASEWLK